MSQEDLIRRIDRHGLAFEFQAQDGKWYYGVGKFVSAEAAAQFMVVPVRLLQRTATSENIQSLRPGEVFVFGSNVDGWHGKGAAKLAHKRFGARWGDGEGLTGSCYALPTVGHNLSRMPVSAIAKHVEKFLETARKHPHMRFLVTQVGCGLAGHKVDDIAPMFRASPPNVTLPAVFIQTIEKIGL